MKLDDIKPGTPLQTRDCGPCVATAKPRRIPGGWVVDVESDHFMGKGQKYRWTAVVNNVQVVS